MTRIVISVDGGSIVGVASDNPDVEVLILDTDTEGGDDIQTINTFNTNVEFNCNIYQYDVDNAIEFVDHFFSEWKRIKEKSMKRYEPLVDSSGCFMGMNEDDKGDYVLYDDVKEEIEKIK